MSKKSFQNENLTKLFFKKVTDNEHLKLERKCDFMCKLGEKIHLFGSQAEKNLSKKIFIGLLPI